MNNRLMATLAAFALAGCATVRQSDLDAWVGVPVEKLDTHSLFLTIPMERRVSAAGIETRNYRNGGGGQSCFTHMVGSKKGASSMAFTDCDESPVCNNLFLIKDGKVLEYRPRGHCFTNDTVRPGR